MSKQKIIERIKKLLKLANSSNEHEAAAAAAAAKAQELLSQYNLDESLLSEGGEDSKAAGMASVKTLIRLPSWGYTLASAVAAAFDCDYYHCSGTGDICFIGVDLDHEIASFTFEYLFKTIRSLSTSFMRKSQQRRLTPKGQIRVRRSYCQGCTEVVCRELQEQGMRTPVTTKALVPVKKALIAAEMEKIGITTFDLKTESLSQRAYWTGRRDGANIDCGRKGLQGSNKPYSMIGGGHAQ
ncbi:DUF2786 domain-containing protein [Geobacter sp. FeAm09]|uniref:DUF2786 domain-containing protein n=1 Tax=Geobacter sp. FeAm09 TaxID=2597769 RepID=UPI0011EE3C4E|nr:DUF2786 domain-containing protein [Geobacter sp. FeAm09]QEM66723.1 DUF2786 domain-containing protein [Geobacter sp. FeAm09]